MPNTIYIFEIHTSKPGEHQGEIRTSVPGVTIKVRGTCYIVDYDKNLKQTTMVLFGGGMDLYIQGNLIKLNSPIEMIIFNVKTQGEVKPVSITMDELRARFDASVIPTAEELKLCGLKDKDMLIRNTDAKQ